VTWNDCDLCTRLYMKTSMNVTATMALDRAELPSEPKSVTMESATTLANVRSGSISITRRASVCRLPSLQFSS